LSKKLTAHLAILGANTIYGLNYVIAKGIMPDFMQPRAIIFLRATGAVLLFWIVGEFFPKEKPAVKDILRLAMAAFFGVFLNQVLFFEGLNLTTPINASIIVTVIPVLVLVFAHFLLKEKITSFKVIGIALGGAGAIMVILTGGEVSLASDTFLGNVLVFINAAAFAAYLVIVKPLMLRYHPITVIKYIFLFGALYIIPVSAGVFVKTDFSAIPLEIWGSILYVIIGTTALAYLLNNYSLRILSPTITGSYIYLQPVLASIAALAVGMDTLSSTEIFAALLIFAGVYFVSRKPPKKLIK
jgi:drug/metabolite transporter (DMT)-like permease